ncbi:MAG: flavodoxin family protein [Candidatus Bathyarchaeia archaeon]|jgi:multimeric flavodoxin WrbA
MKSALIIYWSKTGNTEKVANAIKQGLEEADFKVTLTKPEEAEALDYLDFDLVCVGCPSYSWHPPEPMTAFLKKKFAAYRQNGKIKPGSPKIPGKNALMFVTYSGPHTGINEATPVGKDLGQYFEHLGFTVIDEWYVLSEFHGSLAHSTQGRLGDVRGKPTAEQLQVIKDDAKRIGKLI